MNQQHPFKWRHFESEIILLCVRWYLRYSLSYRDLEEMMAERGLFVDHTTIYRWFSTLLRSWKRSAGPNSGPQTIRGGWAKRMEKAEGSGGICTVESILMATPWGAC